MGAAFLVTPTLLLTAAHVVALAAGNGKADTQRPSGAITIAFVVAPDDIRQVEVVHWVPPGDVPPEDIAGLRLTGPPPAGVTPVTLTDLREPLGRRVVTLGFPRDAPHGGWGLGRLADADARDLVQVDTLPDSQFTIEEGFSGTPVWDVEDRAVAGLVIEGWTRGRRSGFMIPTSVLLASWPELARQVWPASPFRGLKSFTEQDSAVFFGRDELVDRIVTLTEQAPALTVIGPSGIGKSSLVHAGVLPKLRRRPGLVVATMRPSEAQTPLRALALALARAADPGADPLGRGRRVDDFAARLARGLIAEVVGAVLESRSGERLLLVVDQFEEILLAEDDLTLLAPALTYCLRAGSRLDVLTALRADFLGRVLQRRDLAELVQDVRLVTVGELSQSELRTAIVEPVRRTRMVRYEPGLVDRLVTDVGVAPGRLPLLQFTLAMLWEEQKSGELTHRAYDDMGGIDSALAGHAEAVWAGLGATERAAAGRLLVQLLYPLADGPGFVRRVARRAQLDSAQWGAAQRLAADRARLVVVRTQDTDRVAELAHDALVTHWRRLGELGERNREFREWQESLRQRMRQWQRRSRPADRLLSGADLRDALRWRVQRAADLAPDELSYVDASRQRRRKLRRRLGVGVVAVGAVAALVATQVQSGVADKAADTIVNGRSRTDPYAELRTTLRAHRTSGTETVDSQVDAEYSQYQRIDRVLPDYTAEPLSVGGAKPTPLDTPSSTAQKVSADGTGLVTTDPRDDVTVWRVHGDQVTGHALGEVAVRVTISRDGRYVAYLQNDIPQLNLDGGPTNPCATSGADIDGRYCVTLYDTVTKRRRRLGVLHPNTLTEIPVLRFDPTGHVLAVAYMAAGEQHDFQQRVDTWDVASGRRRSGTLLGGAELDTVKDMWLLPGGDRMLLEPEIPSHPQGRVLYTVLVSASLTGPTANIPVLSDDMQVDSVAVSGDGRRLALLVPNSTLLPDKDRPVVLDVATGRQLASYPETRLGDDIGLDQHGGRLFVSEFSGAITVHRVGAATTRPVTLHTDRWEVAFQAGDSTDGPLVLVEQDVIGLVLPAAGRPAPLRRLATPPPYVPGETSPEDEHPDQWADAMTSMLASGVPNPGEVDKLPAGAYAGPLGG